MNRSELIDKMIDAMSESKGQSDEGEFPMLYDIIDAQPNAARLILRAAAEAALSEIEAYQEMFVLRPKPVDPDKMDEVGRKIADTKGWGPGEVDRQGGSFTDREIIERLTWR